MRTFASSASCRSDPKGQAVQEDVLSNGLEFCCRTGLVDHTGPPGNSAKKRTRTTRRKPVLTHRMGLETHPGASPVSSNSVLGREHRRLGCYCICD